MFIFKFIRQLYCRHTYKYLGAYATPDVSWVDYECFDCEKRKREYVPLKPLKWDK